MEFWKVNLKVKIAVQQPYFIPYPGYYYLHKEVDTFVILDDVQFNRRGFVHRNKVEFENNSIKWLTLPLKKKDQKVKINDLEFDKKSEQFLNFKNIISKFENNKNLDFLFKNLSNLDTTPLKYINNLNEIILKKLKIECNFILSSKISENNLSGESKIIDICKKLKATNYINLPGGRKLYDINNFEKENIKVHFLNEYIGKKISILNYFEKNDPMYFEK